MAVYSWPTLRWNAATNLLFRQSCEPALDCRIRADKAGGDARAQRVTTSSTSELLGQRLVLSRVIFALQAIASNEFTLTMGEFAPFSP